MDKNRVYYLWGEEAYLIDRKIKEIAAGMRDENGEEPELILVDGDEISFQALGETLQFSGLFALARIVVIKNPSWMGKNTRKAKKAEEVVKVLQDYMQQDQSGQSLVITCPEHIGTNPVAKFLDKQAQVMNLKPLNPKALGEWLKDAGQQRGLQIDNAALNLLVNSGQDMYYLENLLEKLSLIKKADKITLGDIETELDSRQEIKVFKLTDALLSRNLAASLEAFYQLQEQGEPYLLMLAMISRQMQTMSKVKFYQEAGYTPAQIADASNQKDFVVRKMMEKSARFSAADIRLLFKKLLEVDLSFKGDSKDPQILMETLIIDFCSPNQKK